MNQQTTFNIPKYVWIISSILLAIPIYLQLFTSVPYMNYIWLSNIISIYLFTFHVGLLAGIIVLLLVLVLRTFLSLENYHSLSFEELFLFFFINFIILGSSIAIGYIAGKNKSNELRMKELFDNNDITFWSKDMKSGKLTVTEGNASILGISRMELESDPTAWHNMVHPDDKHIIKSYTKKQRNGLRAKVIYRIIRPNGEVRWVEDRATPSFNKRGQLIRVDGVIFDVTSQKEAEEKMNRMAYYDSLTELPNRNWFQIYLNSTLISAKKYNYPLAIMFIDFDNFKRVNDTLGHRAGDLLLKQIANRLQQSVRKQDIVSRQSGDEFLVLIEKASVNEVEEVAKRIIKMMNQPYIVNGTELFSTPSIGISVFPEVADTAESLIEKADFAMYLAKERGKNNYQFYNAELQQKMTRRLMLDARLHKAIDRNELEVHYQPQIDIVSGKLAGVEALIRWKSDMEGYISPNEFIPIAEETGLIIPIGDWVLQEACKHVNYFKEMGLNHFPISVNISTKQLMNPHFIENLTKIMEKEKVEPQKLTLEITESALLFYDDAKQNILELQKLGVGISIDDFGVGYSSLSMIKNIEMDELKIDQSFLNDALENDRVRSLLETIIQIGKKLGAKVVVEGIETAEQLEMLMSYHVYGQGYFYSRPLPKEKFVEWFFTFYQRV